MPASSNAIKSDCVPFIHTATPTSCIADGHAKGFYVRARVQLWNKSLSRSIARNTASRCGHKENGNTLPSFSLRSRVHNQFPSIYSTNPSQPLTILLNGLSRELWNNEFIYSCGYSHCKKTLSLNTISLSLFLSFLSFFKIERHAKKTTQVIVSGFLSLDNRLTM